MHLQRSIYVEIKQSLHTTLLKILKNVSTWFDKLKWKRLSSLPLTWVSFQLSWAVLLANGMGRAKWEILRFRIGLSGNCCFDVNKDLMIKGYLIQNMCLHVEVEVVSPCFSLHVFCMCLHTVPQQQQMSLNATHLSLHYLVALHWALLLIFFLNLE